MIDASNLITPGTSEKHFRNIVLFANMLFPSKDEYVTPDCLCYILKLAIAIHGAAWKGLDSGSAIDIQQNYKFSANFSSYIEYVGGWHVFAELLLMKQQKGLIDETMKRLFFGLLSGEVLLKSLSDNCSMQKSAPIALNTIFSRENMNTMLKDVPSKHIKSIDAGNFTINIWPKFKTVAHLWIPLLDSKETLHHGYRIPYIDFDSISIPASADFPFTGFDAFCVLADMFAQLAFTVKHRKANCTLLDKNNYLKVTNDYPYVLRGSAKNIS